MADVLDMSTIGRQLTWAHDAAGRMEEPNGYTAGKRALSSTDTSALYGVREQSSQAGKSKIQTTAAYTAADTYACSSVLLYVSDLL